MGLIFWYQKIDFSDIRKYKSIFYIKNSEFFFSISENDFLISNILFLDIRKWFFDIRNSIFDIKKSTLFSDIKNSISWYQEIIFWYHKFEFLISENDFYDIHPKFFFFYIKNYFLILKNRIFNIKKSFSDIRKYLKNIKMAPHMHPSDSLSNTCSLFWCIFLTYILCFMVLTFILAVFQSFNLLLICILYHINLYMCNGQNFIHMSVYKQWSWLVMFYYLTECPLWCECWDEFWHWCRKKLSG